MQGMDEISTTKSGILPMAGIIRQTQYQGYAMEERHTTGKSTQLSLVCSADRIGKLGPSACSLSNVLEYMADNCSRVGASYYNTSKFQKSFSTMAVQKVEKYHNEKGLVCYFLCCGMEYLAHEE